MSISAVGSQNSNLLAQFFTALVNDLDSSSSTQTTSTGSTSSTNSAGSNSSSDSSSLSQMGQLVSQLQQLQTSNPTQFKQIMSEVANTLDQEAQSTGGMGGKMLSDLAQSFQNAASTGSLSSLLPSGGGGQVQTGYDSGGQPTMMVIVLEENSSGSSSTNSSSSSSSSNGTGSTDQGQNTWNAIQNDLANLFSQITQQLGSQTS